MKAYNKAVKVKQMQPGDLVLKTTNFIRRKISPPSKFHPHWEGSFVVKAVYASGYYWLMDKDGVTHRDPINGKWLKRYYS